MIYFSVIIPNYNHANYLKQRIESVLSQTCQQFEVIILDDASDDNSKEIIEIFRGHPKISHIIYNTENSGSTFKQWEKGFSLAKGNWIWFAESDDFCSADFLETAYNSIKLYPHIGLFYCNTTYLGNDQSNNKLFSTEKNLYFKTNKWTNDYVSGGKAEIEMSLGIKCTINNASSVILKKELLSLNIKEVAKFKYHGDWYCYISLLSDSFVSYSSKPMNFYRVGSSGIKDKLPEDGKNKIECFQILCYLKNIDLQEKNKLVKEFTLLNLNTGFKKEIKFWIKAFLLNFNTATNVFKHILKARIKYFN